MASKSSNVTDRQTYYGEICCNRQNCLEQKKLVLCLFELDHVMCEIVIISAKATNGKE